MKLRMGNQKTAALTLVEVVVVIAVLAVLFLFIFPFPEPSAKPKALRIMCINNLKQVGLSFRLWEGDNGDKYPMSISVTNGGTMELAGTNAGMSFLVMSNILSTPRILHCPADTNSSEAQTFAPSLTHQNLSYFVGLDAKETDPQGMLAGDDNFEVGGVPVKSGLLNLVANTPLAWSAARHHFAGNVALADGSVQSYSNAGLTNWLSQTGPATNWLAIP